MAYVYSFKNVQVSVSGAAAGGFVPGEGVVSIEFAKERLNPIVGADNGQIMNVSPDKSGKVTLKLLASSSFCNVLAPLYSSLDLTPVPVLVLVRSSTGSDFMTAACFVDSMKWDYGQESPTREFVLKTTQINLFPAAISAIGAAEAQQ